jgi:flagellar hook-length control protein FliK
MVQPTGVNALIAIAGSLPANVGNGSQAVTEDGELGQQFSQLLSDSGKQYDGQAAGQQLAQGKLLKASTIGALSAQEVPAQEQGQLESLLHAREQVISPSDAKELIVRVDKILAQDRAPASVQALTQIKEQLQRIARGGESKTVGEVLQAAPAVKESKLSVLGLTALLSPRHANAAAKPRDDEQEASVNAAVLSHVPTAIFRPDPSDDPAAQATPDKPKTQAPDDLKQAGDASTTAVDTITIITPLAAVTAAPVLAVTSNDTSDAASPLTRSRADLDTLIPPLGPVKTEREALPEVSLPKWSAEAVARKAEAKASFESLANAAGFSTEGVKATDAAFDIKDKPLEGVASVNNPSHAHGFSPTQTVSAAQPVNVVPTHGYVNHAPISEQVHVAVQNAAKDGIEQITVQLDPVDLGRVEVSIQTHRDGQTQISFLVDKPDTFDSLSRDARTLERSLQEAGIKADTGSMQFNLRQQPQPQLQSDAGGHGQQHGQQQAQANEDAAPIRSTLAAIDAATRHYIFNVRDGVDISA